MSEESLRKKMEPKAKTSRTIQADIDNAMRAMIDRNDWGGKLGDLWWSLQLQKWVSVVDAVAVLKNYALVPRSQLKELLDGELENQKTAKAMVACPEREELLAYSWGRIKLLKWLLEQVVSGKETEQK